MYYRERVICFQRVCLKGIWKNLKHFSFIQENIFKTINIKRFLINEESKGS